MGERNERWQGMNWIRQEKRLAIYLRDGLACVYCRVSLEDGAILTLDHLTPVSNGGNNETENLVTCCRTCNSSRGNRSWKTFAATAAEYHNHATADSLRKFIRTTITKPLDMQQAKKIIAARGSVPPACPVVKKQSKAPVLAPITPRPALSVDTDMAQWFTVAQ